MENVQSPDGENEKRIFSHFHTVDTTLQSEWDGEELMLLTHSWGRCHQATDAGSARLLYVRLQHSSH